MSTLRQERYLPRNVAVRIIIDHDYAISIILLINGIIGEGILDFIARKYDRGIREFLRLGRLEMHFFTPENILEYSLQI
jgi:hypothetical protein